ncbi:hypothetical protein DFH08DRAFT_960118 [Mycena albidolilacea]|uniref:Uncharacterized protein n=1 Tax=Mycena albidolilacea TaxID=1033008 RepID=A0AAD7ERM7_9AGAR|nr:hypothetical protein DFH08DRAFT_960118 [Mycena albidolilacea]
MSRKPPAKKLTMQHFAPHAVGPIPSPGSSMHPASVPRTATARVLLEKTQIRHLDGHVSQSRSVVDVAAAAGNKVRPDVPRERLPQPIYNWYSGGDVDADRGDDKEDTHRPSRDSDDPLRQWVEDHRTAYLDEVAPPTTVAENVGVVGSSCVAVAL